MAEKLLPQNTDAEQAVLGALIIEGERMPDVLETGLQPEDFYRDAHRTIFEMMVELYSRREPIDLVTLSDILSQKHRMGDVGGLMYLTSLPERTVSSAFAVRDAGPVLRTSQLRQLIHLAMDLAAKAYEEDDVDAILSWLEGVVFALSMARRKGARLIPLKELLGDYINKLGELYERVHQADPASGPVLIGVPSGFPTLDRYTLGFQNGDLITLAARTGHGKTSLLLTIAYQAALLGIPVGIFSLEMSWEQLVTRFMSMSTGIRVRDLRSGSFGEWGLNKVVDSMGGQLGSAPIYICDVPDVDTAKMRAAAMGVKARDGLGLLIVDYLQLGTASVVGKRIERREQEVGEMARQLKIMAGELGIPVIAAAQLSRAVDARAKKIPHLSDLRESGAIEQHSPLVCFLYREDMEEDGMPNLEHIRANQVDFIVAKNRHDQVGETTLYYEASTTRYMEMEDAERRGYVERMGDGSFRSLHRGPEPEPPLEIYEGGE